MKTILEANHRLQVTRNGLSLWQIKSFRYFLMILIASKSPTSVWRSLDQFWERNFTGTISKYSSWQTSNKPGRMKPIQLSGHDHSIISQPSRLNFSIALKPYVRALTEHVEKTSHLGSLWRIRQTTQLKPNQSPPRPIARYFSCLQRNWIPLENMWRTYCKKGRSDPAVPSTGLPFLCKAEEKTSRSNPIEGP